MLFRSSLNLLSKLRSGTRRSLVICLLGKKKVLARLGGVQKAISYNPSESLIRLEKCLLEEHALIRLQEEEFWALKSRLNAATFGDPNTSYFHITTIVRRHRNKIRSIMDGSGEWLYDGEKIKDHIQQGFSKLYSSELGMVYLDSPISRFSCCFLSEEERDWMGRMVDEDEIIAALWSLKPFKAPGPDGLHAGFFQHFWRDVQDSVFLEIKKAFSSGTIPKSLNSTLISLIPKCNNPESLANYRPISLCNSVYKVI